MTTIPSDPCPSRSHPLAVQLGYSAGNLGKSVIWTSFESVMLFYLVTIAGFAPLSAGMVLAVALLWDAAFDLAVARWADAHGGATGLVRLVLIGAPLCGISFWMIFVAEAPAAVAAAIIACRIGYSFCDVGHNTLLIRVARSSADAGRVSGLRLLFSAAGVASPRDRACHAPVRRPSMLPSQVRRCSPVRFTSRPSFWPYGRRATCREARLWHVRSEGYGRYGSIGATRSSVGSCW